MFGQTCSHQCSTIINDPLKPIHELYDPDNVAVTAHNVPTPSVGHTLDQLYDENCRDLLLDTAQIARSSGKPQEVEVTGVSGRHYHARLVPLTNGYIILVAMVIELASALEAYKKSQEEKAADDSAKPPDSIGPDLEWRAVAGSKVFDGVSRDVAVAYVKEFNKRAKERGIATRARAERRSI